MELLDVPRGKIKELFSNIEDIHRFHVGFCARLEASLATDSLPEVFVNEVRLSLAAGHAFSLCFMK